MEHKEKKDVYRTPREIGNKYNSPLHSVEENYASLNDAIKESMIYPCCKECEIYLDYKDSYQCNDGECKCHTQQPIKDTEWDARKRAGEKPFDSVEEKKCTGYHCRCMDIGGQCQNMHWYHCKEHNPDHYAKGGTRPIPKCNAESNGVKCRPPCVTCYGGVQMTVSTPQPKEEASICKDCKTCNSGKTMYERGYADAVQETLRELVKLSNTPTGQTLHSDFISGVEYYAKSKGITLSNTSIE